MAWINKAMDKVTQCCWFYALSIMRNKKKTKSGRVNAHCLCHREQRTDSSQKRKKRSWKSLATIHLNLAFIHLQSGNCISLAAMCAPSVISHAWVVTLTFATMYFFLGVFGIRAKLFRGGSSDVDPGAWCFWGLETQRGASFFCPVQCEEPRGDG